MGRYMSRWFDYKKPDKKPNKFPVSGEDGEDLPKHTSMRSRNKGTFRYKRPGISYKVLDRIMRKHVNEPYEMAITEISRQFGKDSYERKFLEGEILWLVAHDGEIWPWEGHIIVDGIIRYVQRQNKKFVIIYP